jgi:hypothetical protein
MGLYSNPLAYTGYQPQVTGKPYTTNNTVRAATQEEVDEGSKDFLYVSPLTLSSSITTDLASPPRIGNVTPNQVTATLLRATSELFVEGPLNLFGPMFSAGDVEIAADEATEVLILCGFEVPGAPNSVLRLGNNPSVNRIDIGNTTTTSDPRITNINGGDQEQDDTLRLQVGAHSAGAQTTNIMTGAHTGGTQSVNILTGTSPGGTQNLRLGSSTTNIGFLGQSPAAPQTQAALTNNVTAGGSTGVIANFATTDYATDGPIIRNDIYQLALALRQTIAALRTYGLLQ